MKKFLSLFVFMASLFANSTYGEETPDLKVGDKAPQKLSAVNQDGKTINLSDSFTKGWTLVYFYPKADTPGCTAQACSLRDAYEVLQEKGIKVFGISRDDAEHQKKFQEKYKLPFILIADTDGKICTAFTVPISSSGTAARQAFLIKDGIIVWIDRKASTKEQADDILNFLKEEKS